MIFVRPCSAFPMKDCSSSSPRYLDTICPFLIIQVVHIHTLFSARIFIYNNNEGVSWFVGFGGLGGPFHINMHHFCFRCDGSNWRDQRGRTTTFSVEHCDHGAEWRASLGPLHSRYATVPSPGPDRAVVVLPNGWWVHTSSLQSLSPSMNHGGLQANSSLIVLG